MSVATMCLAVPLLQHSLDFLSEEWDLIVRYPISGVVERLITDFAVQVRLFNNVNS